MAMEPVQFKLKCVILTFDRKLHILLHKYLKHKDWPFVSPPDKKIVINLSKEIKEKQTYFWLDPVLLPSVNRVRKNVNIFA